jgi:hypothetical protein
MNDGKARLRFLASAAWLAVKIAAVVALAYTGHSAFVYQNF